MIVDTSALLAILFGEEEAVAFNQTIDRAPAPKMSAVSYLEVALRVDRLPEPEAYALLDSTIRTLRIEIVPVTVEQAYLARAAFGAFGRGRHPAALNFGDCFVYALARARGEPLLFKGQDFGRTDLVIAAVG
ncbi:MAG: hypothetical protein RLY86_928 [Pseudomonadota bacterium]|jgi:ribonuclease VapC